MVPAMTPAFPAATVAVLRPDSGRIRQMTGLRELYLQAIEAYNAHDLDRFLGYYADDCEVTVPGFPPFQGKAAAREC
jgi:ketosteroid isomerase-like protein